MFKLLFIIFFIKLYVSISIYKFIQEKHGQDIIKNMRFHEKLKTKLTKLITDIVYIKSCKKEGGYKLKKKVAKLVMDTELQDKHYQIRKMRRETRSIAISLKSLLGLVLFNAVIHQVEVFIRSRLAAIKKSNEKKLFNLRQQNVNARDSAVTKQMIHKFFLVQFIT